MHAEPDPEIPVGTAVLFVAAMRLRQEESQAERFHHDATIRAALTPLRQLASPPLPVVLTAPLRHRRAWAAAADARS